jgi:hypothetical protein
MESLKISSSPCQTPSPVPNPSKFYQSPLTDEMDQRRFSFSDVESMSPQTPSPYKASERRHRPHIYHNNNFTNSPPVPLFLYRQTSGDLASTEDRGKSFLPPPDMRKDDIHWIDKIRAFFSGSSSTSIALPSSPSVPRHMNTNQRVFEEPRSVPMKKSRSLSEHNVTPPGRSQFDKTNSSKGGISQYRQRREEEKKVNGKQLSHPRTSNTSSRSPFDTRMRSQSERVPRTPEKVSVRDISPSLSASSKFIPSPVDIPTPGSPGSSQDLSPGRNSDNCTPVNTRVPFFPADSPASLQSTPSQSSPPRPLSVGKKSPFKQSSNTSTLMTPQQPPRRSAPKPPLTATPLRDMMASLSPSVIINKLKDSDLHMTSAEATDLLKYLLVNYGDLNNEYLLPEHEMTKSLDQIEQEERCLLQTLSILINQCHADVNSLDRDGNSLLTFIVQYNSSSPSPDLTHDGPSNQQRGINKLVSCLVFHGINLFVESNQQSSTIHEAFLDLTADDQIDLIEQFIQAEVDEGVESEKIMTPQQILNYCVVLILIGRIRYASQLLESSSDKVKLTSSQASAILKNCKFENMENPVDAFELLDRYGAQL